MIGLFTGLQIGCGVVGGVGTAVFGALAQKEEVKKQVDETLKSYMPDDPKTKEESK